MAALPPTPWLQAPDAGALYLKGMSLGAERRGQELRTQLGYATLAQRSQEAALQAQAASEALAQRERLAKMQSEVDRERIQSQAMMAQQRLAISDAYRNAQLGLAQQRIFNSQQANQMRFQQAARSFAARQRMAERIKAGEDPRRVALELSGDLQMPGGSISALAGSLKPAIPPQLTVTEVGGEKFYMGHPSRGYVHIQKVRPLPVDTLSAKDRAELQQLNTEKKRLYAKLAGGGVSRAMEMNLDDIPDEVQRNNVKALQAQGRKYQSDLVKAQSRIDYLLKRADENANNYGQGTAPQGGGEANFQYDPKTGEFKPISSE